MRAVVYEAFGRIPTVEEVPEPAPAEHGAVVRVEATGLCRSDWHGWMGHDPDIRRFPHVPGHELAGVVEAVGAAVRRWRPGDRVTVPFVCACGQCPQCAAGAHQVCDEQTQPGFTHWGSFAELVALDWADVNLVALPDALDADAAASLGCRFATAYRALVHVARVRPGEWVAVHGCGGVGLCAVMIAAAAGARVVALWRGDRPRRETVLDKRDVIVLGASAGGIEALMKLCGGLPADLPASLLVVQRVAPTARSVLPELLARAGPLPAPHRPTAKQSGAAASTWRRRPAHAARRRRGPLCTARGS